MALAGVVTYNIVSNMMKLQPQAAWALFETTFNHSQSLVRRWASATRESKRGRPVKHPRSSYSDRRAQRTRREHRK
eukprot:4035288-Amphidinium_carterae.1